MTKTSTKERFCFAAFLVSCTCVILGFVMLICFGKMYIEGYRKTLGFSSSAQCSVINTTYIGPRACNCNQDSSHLGNVCRSTFPCFQVRVSHTGIDGEVIGDALLYYDFNAFKNRHNEECSYWHCLPLKSSVIRSSDVFLKQYGSIGSIYDCYYEPLKPHIVIREIVPKVKAVASMTVATMLFVGGIITSCVFHRYRLKKARSPQHELLTTNATP